MFGSKNIANLKIIQSLIGNNIQYKSAIKKDIEIRTNDTSIELLLKFNQATQMCLYKLFQDQSEFAEKNQFSTKLEEINAYDNWPNKIYTIDRTTMMTTTTTTNNLINDDEIAPTKTHSSDIELFQERYGSYDDSANLDGDTTNNDTENKSVSLKFIRTNDNYNACVKGYYFSEELARTLLSAVEILRKNFNDNCKDFGATILCINFAEYQSHNQYHLFVHEFSLIPELQIFEDYLIRCSTEFVKLPAHLSIDEVYGIRANLNKFTKSSFITYQEMLTVFVDITLFSNKNRFLTLIADYHLRIIEMFYALVTFRRKIKVITEARGLHTRYYGTFVKKFKNEITFNGDYWFIVPPKSIWFSYANNHSWSCSSFLSRTQEHLFEKLKPLNAYTISGFIQDSTLYPIQMRSIDVANDNWTQMIEIFKFYKLNVAFKDSSVQLPIKNFTCRKKNGQSEEINNKNNACSYMNNVYFVKNKYDYIFKLQK